jgi:AcrR family transcriptional regulator
MKTISSDRRSARDRLLDAADELFYGQGIHTVGIDRVIEHAGVAKASLYTVFGSKDELIGAYLKRRLERRSARIAAAVARHDDPREKLLAVFDVYEELFTRPDYRGCAFINAGAETPSGTAIEQATSEARAWIRGLFEDLAREAGAADPGELAQQLVLLYDGTAVSGRMDRRGQAAGAARKAAAILIDAAKA